MNQPADEVNRLAAETGIDLVQVRALTQPRAHIPANDLSSARPPQLHGDEDSAFMAAITKPVLKVVHVKPDTSVDQVTARGKFRPRL